MSTRRDPGAPARAPRGWMALCLALFLSTVGLAALAATLSSSRRDGTGTGSEREVRDISARFATALLSYDYRNLAPAKANILALSTPNLQARYEREFPQLAQALTQGQVRAAAKVTRVYLGPISTNSATAIVVANAAQDSKSGVRAAVASYIQLDLARVSGKWLVNQVVPIKNGDPANLQPADATTTTAK